MFSKKGIIAASLTAALLVPSMSANAESISDLKQEKKQVEKKKAAISNKISAKKEKIADAQNSIEKSAKQVSKLNGKIDEADDKIKGVQAQIVKTKDEITELQKSIEKLQKKIDERGEILKERARAMQETGGQVGYLDVLLGANSFSDFIDRASAVNEIVNADEGIIEDQKRDQQKVKDQQNEVKEKLALQVERKDKLVDLKADLNNKKAVKKEALKHMEKLQAQLNKQRKKLEGEYEEALQVSKGVQRKIEAEQRKAAEKARKIAEAKAAKERAIAQSKLQSQSKAVAGSTVSAGEAPVVSSGTWMKPASGRFTSGFAGRDIGAGNEYHYGIDIANSAGTPIVASADGVVFKASPLSTYGNVVMITHNIGGKTYTSLYAHMSGFATSPGKVVKKGEVIGYMGSTGRSTGPHVHFEIHIGSWVNQATGAVNPLQYISL
ncbi:peptidase [Kurthia zopfii]|uniref:Peptidoglycan DL-endopeptidase CwlO n=1 Tax=Kurthia zopfii TaxID=1650 RepID=A0A8B4Q6B2_9BACL|nr:M23 family metallopeptidase [Kurthia zopfii]TDR31575.1 septal ring factor EnvC (AmiA/AmiB activator) [Kurthia zopfii]GEK32409.1 peptidase [Kurthia zopfii]STX08828.1 Peptidoglycan DL-endopeptidase CwlO precursor [Kurthia zopfii]